MPSIFVRKYKTNGFKKSKVLQHLKYYKNGLILLGYKSIYLKIIPKKKAKEYIIWENEENLRS